MANFKKQETDSIKDVAGMHVTFNSTFIFITVTLFTFIIAENGQLLKQDYFLGIQLILSILLFIYSSMSRSRNLKYNSNRLNKFAITCFSCGLVFFLNSVGILIFYLVSKNLSILFFIFYITIFMTYYTIIGIDRHELKKKIKVKKDLLILLIILFLGFFHILGFY